MTKNRVMRLEENVWEEMKRVGKLGGMSRAQLIRTLNAHIFPKIKSADDLSRLLSEKSSAAKNNS